MPSFRYEVADQKGRVLTGTMDATTQHEVIERLREQGYIVRGIASGTPVQAAPAPSPQQQVIQSPLQRAAPLRR